MTWQQFAADASPWIATATFLAAAAFVIGYSIIAPWWRRSIGWTIVLLDLVIIILMLPVVLLLVLHHHPRYLSAVSITGSEFWTFTILGAVAAVPLIITWRFILLARAQWRGRKGEP